MLANVRLQNFRSYRDSSFEFENGVNIIVGPNASGKTNLLESLMVVCNGNSFRAKGTDLISFKNKWLRIDAITTKGSSRTIKIDRDDGKSYEIDKKKYKRLSVNTMLPLVVFEPENLRLFSGGPERRREYLDDLLEQIKPGYGQLRRNYRRSLAQRNSLLKYQSTNYSQAFPWNIKLSQLAGQIVGYRLELINEINEIIGDLYKKTNKINTELSLSYGTQLPIDTYETNMLKKLEDNHDHDRLRGYTSYGPHRDDLDVFFNQKPAKQVASRGEIRSAVLSLKIAELETLERIKNMKPILLLDDVFSELDGRRRHGLTDILSVYQTFITTTEADIVLKNFTTKANIIPTGKL